MYWVNKNKKHKTQFKKAVIALAANTGMKRDGNI